MNVFKEFGSLCFLFLNTEQHDGMFQESWSEPGLTIQNTLAELSISQAVFAPNQFRSLFLGPVNPKDL
tara:strand:- start:41544 stop:41747 length:204 start_codon:yes stop_codon:yes gene_type:complete